MWRRAGARTSLERCRLTETVEEGKEKEMTWDGRCIQGKSILIPILVKVHRPYVVCCAVMN